MTKYREILRLKSLGFSERNIAHSWVVSIVFRTLVCRPWRIVSRFGPVDKREF